MALFRTVEETRVDTICNRFYPSIPQGQAIDEVYEANEGLAAYGPILPKGIEINLPVISIPEPKRGIQLWD